MLPYPSYDIEQGTGHREKIPARTFWSFKALISGKSYGKQAVVQNINNVLLFIPFGLFFPLSRFKYIFLTGILYSLLIEICQYIFRLGLCEIDDVISNVFGALIGFWLLLGINLLKKHLRRESDKEK